MFNCHVLRKFDLVAQPYSVSLLQLLDYKVIDYNHKCHMIDAMEGRAHSVFFNRGNLFKRNLNKKNLNKGNFYKGKKPFSLLQNNKQEISFKVPKLTLSNCADERVVSKKKNWGVRQSFCSNLKSVSFSVFKLFKN